MKKVTFALACASAFAIFAEDAAPAKAPLADFESITAGTPLSKATAEANGPFWAFAEGDSSTVKAYETASDRTGANYLELSTEGNTLWRSINAVQTAGQPGAAETIPETGLYVDTMVQFTPTEDGGAPETTGDDKLAIWLNVDSSGEAPVTNLMVKASVVDDQGTRTPTTFTLTNAGAVKAGKWYRLTVKAIGDITENDDVPGFQVLLDGTLMVADKMTVTEEYAELLGNDDISSKTVFASLSSAATLQAVGFKGSGALDNLSISEENPLPAPEEMIGFTITAAEGMEKVEWSTAVDGEFTAYGAGAQAPAGKIYVKLTTADGGVKIVEQTVVKGETNAFDLTDETFGWAEYLGAADTDGAYVIDDQAEFGKFVAKVAALGSEGITFKLAENVTFAGVIGAANNKDNLGKEGFIVGAFKGMFDGQNKTISDVVLPRADYTGLFGSLYGATVKNLTVAVKDGTTGFESEGGTTDFCGGLVAGVSVKSTIENVTTAAGTFKAQKAAAGIVGYAAGGTILKDCVNNLNVISMGNEKVAGLVGCAQNSGTYEPAYVTIDGCTNNGNVECQASGKSRAALLVSYSDCEVKFQGTITARGTVTQAGSTANIQSIININGGSATVVDGAVITAPVTMKSTIHNGKAHAGLNYATVADGVATFVADSAAVSGANLKVMTTGNTITLANIDDSITLDTTLATVTVTTTVENAEVKQEGNVYTVVAKSAAEDWPEDPSTVAEQTAGDAYGIEGELADAEADKLATWAKANGIAYAGAAEAIKVEAYLLNVANNDAAIAEGKANFKIPAITIDANGTVTVTDPEGSYNGVITIKGSATVNGTYDLVKGTDGKFPEGARFFKAFLSVK